MTRFLLNRRSMMVGTAAALAAPYIVRAQELRRTTLTLPWLAQGATAAAFVAQSEGYYAHHGLDVSVSRGNGSVAAAQAIAQGQFDFGLISAGPTVLVSARGTPLSPLATVSYETTMGILVRDDSPIRTAQDLVGKRIGSVVTSAEAPFWPGYAANSGLDVSDVEIVQMDSRVLERTMIDGQVDAITCIGVSSIPVVASQKIKHRFLPFSAGGIAPYAYMIVTRPQILEEDPDLCQSMVSSLLEAVAFQLREPEKALDGLIAQVPELALTAGGRENATISQGLMLSTIMAPESVTHGLGWTDPEKWQQTVDLTMQYAVPAGAARPDLDEVSRNRFSGGVTLDQAEWAAVADRIAPYRAMVG